MKLILSSAGFTTEEIVKTCERLAGIPRQRLNVAIINEAYAVEHDNNLRWVLDDLNRVRDTFGGNLELVNILALDKQTVMQRLNLADMIFVTGGHTDYLMDVLSRQGILDILPELLKTKLYVGSSAGAMVMGKRLSSEGYRTIYGEDSSYPIKDYAGYIDVSILPHLDSPHFHNRRAKIDELAQNYHGTLYGLRDDSAIVVEDDILTTIGSEPYIVRA